MSRVGRLTFSRVAGAKVQWTNVNVEGAIKAAPAKPLPRERDRACPRALEPGVETRSGEGGGDRVGTVPPLRRQGAATRAGTAITRLRE